jgi:hypothetical protein
LLPPARQAAGETVAVRVRIGVMVRDGVGVRVTVGMTQQPFVPIEPPRSPHRNLLVAVTVHCVMGDGVVVARLGDGVMVRLGVIVREGDGVLVVVDCDGAGVKNVGLGVAQSRAQAVSPTGQPHGVLYGPVAAN